MHQSAIGRHVSFLFGAVYHRKSALIYRRVPFLLVSSLSLSLASHYIIP